MDWLGLAETLPGDDQKYLNPSVNRLALSSVVRELWDLEQGLLPLLVCPFSLCNKAVVLEVSKTHSP